MSELSQKDDIYLTGCRLCPRACGVRRHEGQTGFCGAAEEIVICRAALHMWEEPCISGHNGSGAVFFAGCNLHCCFCQNYEISRKALGTAVSVDRLAEIFLELQEKHANNINLVTPTHYALKIKEALLKARKNGLSIPVVYNCGGYEAVETVRLLENVIDVWMPDMKYMSPDLSERYSKAPDYFERAGEALAEMVRQVEKKGGMSFEPEKNYGSPEQATAAPGKKTQGDSPVYELQQKLLTRGVLVRHMTLPDATADSKRIIRYLHNTYGDRILLSIMSQYTPMSHIMNSDDYPELKRRVDEAEYGRLVSFAEKIGVENAFVQDGEVAQESFIPSFDGTGV